jgi:RNA 2',3'-cyclic 3'-phosphodiesterase
MPWLSRLSRRPVSRLFVALWPPPSLTLQLRTMERPRRPGVRWTTEDQWHVTLRFLGEISAEEEETLGASLAQMAATTPPPEAVAGPGPRALGAGVWVLPVEGLGSLASSIAAATRDIGQPPPGRPYRGHLTLARGRRPDSLRGLPVTPLAGTWLVRDLTLVRSTLDPSGARYEVVGRWALEGRVP